MPRLANISGKKAVRAFLKFGYRHVHTSGDHAILQKTGSPSLSLSVLSVVPKILLVGNVLMVLVSLVAFVSFARLVAKQGTIPETLFDMRKRERSFFIRNVAIWEWVLVFLIVLWSFIISLVVLS